MDTRKFYYQEIADEFESLDNKYDLARRISIVFNDLLKGIPLQGSKVLDLGCGYGAFSIELAKRGVDLISADIGELLVRKTSATTNLPGAVLDACSIGLKSESIDIMISSEMIEHTLSPTGAVREAGRILKVGGYLILTTPNYYWQWMVRLASALRIRPFQGYERFVRWIELERMCEDSGLELLRHVGFHPWPFQLRALNKLSLRVDEAFGESFWARLMINQAILATKVT